jgi:hypothetical protein
MNIGRLRIYDARVIDEHVAVAATNWHHAKEPMKAIEKVGAQGDILFVRIDDAEIPGGLKLLNPSGGHHILAYSSTGHHHVVREECTILYEVQNDPFTRYLRVDEAPAKVEHQRSFDTHESVELGQGLWMVRRQREHTPEGYRMVED